MRLRYFLRSLILPFAVVALASAGHGENWEQISAEIRERLGHGLKPGAGTIAAEPFSLPPGVTPDEPLSENDAVAIALWNNSGLQATLTELGRARADLIEAGLLVNPDLQLLFGIGTKPFESALTAPIEALWQRPKRVALAKLNLAGVSQSLVQNGIDLARDVRVAHAELALAEERARISAQQADLQTRIAALTNKRHEAGEISRLEAHLVSLEALTARNRAEEYTRDVELVRHRLCLLLGLRQNAPPVAIAASPASLEEPGTEQRLLEAAMSSRPDLRAAELAIEAAGRRAGWEKSKVLTLVAPLLSSKQVGSDLSLKSGPGLHVELPVFNRNRGGITRADVEVTTATFQYMALADQVAFEVRDSRVKLLQAQESLKRLRRQILPEVEEALQFAKKAYENGDISYLELQQASLPLLETKLLEENALLRVRSAEAQLSRAVGRKL